MEQHLSLYYSEAACSSGYTPFLNFDVQDMSETIPRLLMLGAMMDGPIKYPTHGKVKEEIIYNAHYSIQMDLYA
jgi:hypothetical protein